MDGFIFYHEDLKKLGFHVFNHPDGILLLSKDREPADLLDVMYNRVSRPGDYLGIKV